MLDNYCLMLNSLYEEVKRSDCGGNNFYTQKPKIEEIDNILFKLNETITNNYNIINQSDCIVFDSAGIGDIVHSRLVVQHLSEKYKNIIWLVPLIIQSLYKEDNLVTLINCCSIRYRNPNRQLENKLMGLVDYILKSNFPNKIIYNIPFNVIKYYVSGNLWYNFSDLWFKSNNIIRDFDIKHLLNHNGNINEFNLNIKNKYLVLEYNCLGADYLGNLIYENFINILSGINIDCVCIGSSEDSKLNNGIDCRGYSLYDTLTLIKNSCGFVGRCSGNECLTAFYPHIPIFEVEPQANVTIGNEKYIDKKLVHVLNKNNFINYIVNYYK